MDSRFRVDLDRYLAGKMLPEEEGAFLEQIRSGRYEEALNAFLDRDLEQAPGQDSGQESLREILFRRLEAELGLGARSGKPRIIRVLRSAMPYAAALLVCLAGYSVYRMQAGNPGELRAAEQARATRVPESSPSPADKAFLELSDGSLIWLDSLQVGTVTRQGNSLIEKHADGSISYRRLDGGPGEAAFNTMRTPRGGQYQLGLPDGTRVWLNAVSSITYPTVFSDSLREVHMEGEAYFEVRRDERRPFIVQAGGERIRVLGTSFNVSSYPEDKVVRTTLLEGSVQIEDHVLKPGFQYAGGVVRKVNPQQFVAWKNGYFHFNNTSVEDVMRQLARWYDVEVIYEGRIPRVTFGGEMQRSLPLSDVVDFLNASRVRVRLEGRKLILGAR